MKKLFFSVCLLWLATLSAYAQSLQEKLIGKWVAINHEYFGEVAEYSEALEWNTQSETVESRFEFTPNGKAQIGRRDTDYAYSLEDSLLLLKNGESNSTLKYKVEEIATDSLRLLYLDLLLPKFNALEENVIRIRSIYKRLLTDSLTVDENASAWEESQVLPEFPGGTASLMNFLAQNIRYPKAALQHKKSGIVLAGFVVSSTGEIINGSIIRSPRIDFALETVRVLKHMPRWKPGKQNGKPVAVKYILPVRFRF